MKYQAFYTNRQTIRLIIINIDFGMAHEYQRKYDKIEIKMTLDSFCVHNFEFPHFAIDLYVELSID